MGWPLSWWSFWHPRQPHILRSMQMHRIPTPICTPRFLQYLYIPWSVLTQRWDPGTKLIGSRPAPEKVTLFSNELQVTAATPPSFLVHTSDDNGARWKTVCVITGACVKRKCRWKYILYPSKWPHGFGVLNKTTDDNWLERLKNWLNRL